MSRGKRFYPLRRIRNTVPDGIAEGNRISGLGGFLNSCGMPVLQVFQFFFDSGFDFLHFGIIFQWQMKKTFAASQRPIT